MVSLGSTGGWRAADQELRAALERAGASVRLVQAQPPPELRTLAATDLAWALAARRAARAVESAPAVVYCSITAALLWRRPGAIRFDTLARENRPGRHGLWQRPVERLRLRQAPLLIPMAEGTQLPPTVPAVTVPVAVERSGPEPARREIAAITYGANPRKKGIARVVEAFARVARPGEQLLIAGCEQVELERAGIDLAPGVEVVGRLPRDRYRELLRRCRVYICAPEREDYGIAQLEALADGCQLVTTPAPGPYPALALASQLDRRLVGNDLARGLRAALDSPKPDYARRAERLLAPFSPATVQAVVAAKLLPALAEAAAGRR